MEWDLYFRLLSEDIILIVKDLTYLDFLRPLGFCLFLGVMCVPLKTLDRRDEMTALMYTLFGLFGGSLLIIIYPDIFIGKSSIFHSLFLMLLFGWIPYYRWYWNQDTREEIKTQLTSTEHLDVRFKGIAQNGTPQQQKQLEK